MNRWKRAFALLLIVCIVLVGILIWQDRKVRKEISEEYVLLHASLEQAIELALEEYEQSANARQLSADLMYAHGPANAIIHFPALTQLNGIAYTSSISHMPELMMNFDYGLQVTVLETAALARDGEIAEDELQLLKDHLALLKQFNELTLTADFGEKGIEDFEAEFDTFYKEYQERALPLP